MKLTLYRNVSSGRPVGLKMSRSVTWKGAGFFSLGALAARVERARRRIEGVKCIVAENVCGIDWLDLVVRWKSKEEGEKSVDREDGELAMVLFSETMRMTMTVRRELCVGIYVVEVIAYTFASIVISKPS